MSKTTLLKTAAAAALLAAAAGASAQTVLKIGYATTKESHYGVGSTVFCDEIAKGTSNRYTCRAGHRCAAQCIDARHQQPGR